MRQEIIQEIVRELQILNGHFLRNVFQFSPLSLAIDFGVRDAGCLFVSVEPAQPRIYLIKRNRRALEKQAQAPSHFVQGLRSAVGRGKLTAVIKDKTERIVRFRFVVESDIGAESLVTFVCQLTGRSANLLLLDENDQIRHALRPPRGHGQKLGQTYQPPPPQISSAEGAEEAADYDRKPFTSLSEVLDDYYTKLEQSLSFANRSKRVLDRVKKEVSQRKKLRTNLKRDLAEHGDPEQHKRLGDLLLANISSAVRSGNEVRLKDYYSEGEPEILLPLDQESSLQDEAQRYFGRYTKAKRAAQQIATRLARVDSELSRLQKRKSEIEAIVAAGDEAALAKYDDAVTPATRTKKSPDEKLPGVRRYLSSDQYEILVGRAAQTNDKLTFKIARPHDLWLHAADYPGSHVVVRNPNRKEIPHRTIVEAAQLAAKFSQAGADSKVTVHYTQRKFLAKPKGAAPGLVRMSSFKTVTVTPAEAIPRLGHTA